MADPASPADAREVAAAAPCSAAAIFAIRPTHGERSLLSCDFTSQDRPGLVTALLSAFLTAGNGGSLEPLEIWNLPVSTRHLWLVRIAAALDATTALTLQLRCQQTHCQEWLEVSLPIVELEALHDQQAANETLALTSIEAPLTLRRPTGNDLRRWQTAGTASDDPARQQMMLRDLIVSGTAPGNFPPLDDALETFDPLLAFTLSAVCPACRGSTTHQIDLERMALMSLRTRQTRLLQEIHQLARAYGWTEEEVLAVPSSRRLRYLELVEASPTA